MNDEAVYLGCDIGGTNIRAALVTGEGTLVSAFIDEQRKPPSLEQMKEIFCSLIDTAQKEQRRIAAVGIGLAGIVDPETLTLVSSSSLAELERRSLSEDIRRITGDLPCSIHNDANAAGYAEWQCGVGQGYHQCLALFVGTGIGGAMILNGELFTGKNGAAGEIGHMVLHPQGPPCSCGGRGCLEQLASGTAILRSLQQAPVAGHVSPLQQYDTGLLRGQDIVAAAQQGDRLAIDVYAEAGRWLGVAVATLVNLCNVEMVILGGGVWEGAHHFLWPSLRTAFSTYVMAPQGKALRIEQGILGRRAGAIGAALLARHTFSPPFKPKIPS